jgi:putative ABC transport system substrate-binding protein
LKRTASNIRFAIPLLMAVVLIAPLASAAEVAILKSADVAYYDQAIQAFRSIQSSNTTITEYNLAGNLARGREIAKSLRGAPPDLVFAVGLKAALAAKLELVDTPTLFCLVLNPESHGLPAPNMTGISMRVSPDEQLASIRTMAPHAKRIGLLYDPDQTGPVVAEAQLVARKLGIEVLAVAVDDSATVPNALRKMLPKIDLFWLLQDQTVVTHDSLEFILRTTLDSKVPVFGFSPTLVQQGALGALVINARDIGRQAGALASAMLRDRVPTRQPLQEPTHPELAINLNTADYFGLSPSRDVLRLATLLYGGPGAVAQIETPKDLIP